MDGPIPVPWIHGLDRTVGYACLVWTGVSGVHGWSYLFHGLDRSVGYACLVWTGVSGIHGWSYLFHGSMDWIGQWDMPVSYGQE